MLMTMNHDERVGTVLSDRYDILEVIGTGGMGTVYKARQRLINRIVAIKMLHRDLINSSDAIRRFQLEAQAASRLSLPNILTIYDFGLTEEGQPYMVMDYLNGNSLDKVLASEPYLVPIRALTIFIQACAALHHAHQNGVLHRDIKPSNIMLVNYDDQCDFVKIVDFGVAKLLHQRDSQLMHLTVAGQVYGTPLYMSPEQCRGMELDKRSDIYSLGCALYRCLTGRDPISADSVLELMLKHINELPRRFNEICPELNLPVELEQVVFKALAKDPDQRYQTMNEFKQALDHIRERLESNATKRAALKESGRSQAYASMLERALKRTSSSQQSQVMAPDARESNEESLCSERKASAEHAFFSASESPEPNLVPVKSKRAGVVSTSQWAADEPMSGSRSTVNFRRSKWILNNSSATFCLIIAIIVMLAIRVVTAYDTDRAKSSRTAINTIQNFIPEPDTGTPATEPTFKEAPSPAISNVHGDNWRRRQMRSEHRAGLNLTGQLRRPFQAPLESEPNQFVAVRRHAYCTSWSAN